MKFIRGGRKKYIPVLPKVDDIEIVSWLPRDISLGWKPNDPKGTLLCGWSEDTGTRQLWEIVEPGANAKAIFLGFICSRPQGVK